MNIALKITLFRVLIAPAFVVAFLYGIQNLNWLWVSLGIAIVSELTDAMDGIIARRLHLVTDAGKLLDPLADSLSRLSAFAAFTAGGIMPLWMLLLCIYRDSIVSTLRSLSASQQIIVGARFSGKLKAIVQAIAIFAVIIVELLKAYQLPFVMEYQNSHLLFLGFSTLITLYSLADYLYGSREVLRKAVQTR